MFHWKPEGCHRRWIIIAIAPFWFSTEHLWTVIMPFWLSTIQYMYVNNFNHPDEIMSLMSLGGTHLEGLTEVFLHIPVILKHVLQPPSEGRLHPGQVIQGHRLCMELPIEGAGQRYVQDDTVVDGQSQEGPYQLKLVIRVRTTPHFYSTNKRKRW